MRFLLYLCLLALIAGASVLGTFFYPSKVDDLPPLQTGDLIFQTLPSPQTPAIAMATKSLLTHIGVVLHTTEGDRVVDSAGVVREWSLEAFLDRGYGRKTTIYRHPAMTDEKQKALFETLKPYYGAKYDFLFLFGNAELYCSELIWLAFSAVGLPIGAVQKLRDLDVSNYFTQAIIKERAPFHPYCQDETLSEDTCINRILDQELVTPVSVARDKALVQLYNNYPF